MSRPNEVGTTADRAHIGTYAYATARVTVTRVWLNAQDVQVRSSYRSGVDGGGHALAALFDGGTEHVGRRSRLRRLTRALLLAGVALSRVGFFLFAETLRA